MTLTQTSSYQCPSAGGRSLCAAAKNSSRSFSQTRYFTFVSNLVNLIQTCIWQGQTQYTDVIKTILSSMCKRNQSVAVSSTLPSCHCHIVNLYEIHSQLLTPVLSISTACCDRETPRTSATNQGWGRKLEAMKTHRNITPQAME